MQFGVLRMRSLLPKNGILLRKSEFIRHTNPWTDTQIHTLLTLHHIAMGGCSMPPPRGGDSFIVLAPSDRAGENHFGVARIWLDMNSKNGRFPMPEVSRGQWWQRTFGPGSPGVVLPQDSIQGHGSQPREKAGSIQKDQEVAERSLTLPLTCYWVLGKLVNHWRFLCYLLQNGTTHVLWGCCD